MKKLSIIFLALFLGACSSLKVTKLDPKTGFFPSKNKASVVTSQPIDLDTRKSLILVPNSEFEKNQIINIGYFDEVITYEELETLIVKNNLSDKVSSIKDRIGVNNAAKHYKPFLWFRFDTRGSGNEKYAQFILTDPLTLDDIFVTETHLDYIWAGVNDQSNWYPMFNSLVQYIKDNSKTYK
jgi:hypothetical protein